VALDPELVERALGEATKRGENLDYFFDQLRSPEWIQPLRNRGYFGEPPDQVVDDEGLVRAPAWSESRYLARVANEAPDLVLDVLRSINTNNERVVEDFVDAALSMPAEYARQVAELVTRWMSRAEHLYFLLPRKAVDLILRLAVEHQLDAMDELIRTLFIPLPSLRESAWRASPRARFSDWEYDHHLRKLAITVTPIAPARFLKTIVELLGTALDLLREGSETGEDDSSRVWRVRVGDDRDRATEVEEALTSAVRDTAIEIRTNAFLGDAELLAILATRDEELLRRIALYALAMSPKPDLEVVRPLVLDTSELVEVEPSPEFRDLLKAVSTRLTSNEISRLVAAISTGPDVERYREAAERWDGKPPTAEEIEGYVANWQASRLALIADALSGEARARYETLIAEHGTPEIPLSWEVTTFVGPNSPLNPEELAAKADDELLRYLAEWKEGKQWGEEPSLEGLARAMAVVAETDPDRLSRLAPRLKGVPPAHLQWILHGFEQAMSSGRSFDWSSVLELSAWVTEQPRSRPGGRGDRYDDLDPGWVWTRRQIAGLLEKGLNSRDACAIPIIERERVWDIIFAIAQDPDPTPEHEREYGGQNMDPLTLSLNTTRPRALRAAFSYAIWVYRSLHGDAESSGGFSEEIPEVVRLLVEHLEPARDPAASVRAVYGQHYANVVALDRDWAAGIAEAVFPDEDSALREAGWGSYVIFTAPYNNVLAMLRQQYLRAAELAGSPGHGFRWMNGDPAEKLGEHLATFFWRGLVAPEDELFSKFWSRASPSTRGHVVEFLGRSATEVPLTSEIQDRLMSFWAWVIENSGDGDDAAATLRGFSWWFRSDELPIEWRSREMSSLVARRIQPEPAFIVAETLPAVAEQFPQDALRQLRALIQQGDPWSVDAWREHVEQVLRRGFESSDAATLALAQETLDWLLTRGHRDLRRIVRA
jgi:hypothetical protein